MDMSRSMTRIVVITASLFTLLMIDGYSRADDSRKVKIVMAIGGSDMLLPFFLSSIQEFETKHPDETWLFAKHLLGDRFQTAMMAESLPANRHLAQKLVDENMLKPDNLQSILDATAFLYPTPRIANLNDLLELWMIAVQKVFQSYGTSRWEPPEKAFDEAARRINETIAKRKRR